MRQLQQIPPPPRSPSPLAYQLIFRYRGLQSGALIGGGFFSLMGLLILIIGLWPIALVFGGFGLWYLSRTIRENNSEIEAYTRGAPALAKVTSADYVLTSGDGEQEIYAISWEFSVSGALYKGSLSSTDKQELEPLIEHKEVVVLYLPEDPTKNTIYIE